MPTATPQGTAHTRQGVWWAFLAIVVAALVAGCGGSSGAKEVERPTEATAERVRIENGAATLQSVVRVAFPGPIDLALEGQELLEAIRLQTPGAGAELRATRVPVAEVSVEGEGNEGNVLVIETDGLVPNETEVRIDRAALADGASGSVATDVSADLSQLQVLLASVAVEPTRPELFSGGQQAPVEAADRDPEAQRQALEAHLRARGSNEDVIAEALETYDSMPGDVVADPKLAAAIAGLTGTFAEPAITDLLTENNCTRLPAARIAFEEPGLSGPAGAGDVYGVGRAGGLHQPGARGRAGAVADGDPAARGHPL
ncbi:MAG: hypothetical protein U5Q44_05480 [Dehalococcoidia bacterium]|nr:hypothetical protein [Dehalococcoidia bacterium]